MGIVEEKLANVEHQLETAKVEVTKPFPQEAELSEKLERLAELNALLNMDEKGDSAMVMDDDEPENTEQSELPDTDMVADSPAKPVAMWTMSERIAEHRGKTRLADGQNGRISIREKLAEMKEKASGQRLPDKPEFSKSKDKQESL